MLAQQSFHAASAVSHVNVCPPVVGQGSCAGPWQAAAAQLAPLGRRVATMGLCLAAWAALCPRTPPLSCPGCCLTGSTVPPSLSLPSWAVCMPQRQQLALACEPALPGERLHVQSSRAARRPADSSFILLCLCPSMPQDDTGVHHPLPAGLQGGQDRVLVLPGLCLDINCERECVHPLGW